MNDQTQQQYGAKGQSGQGGQTQFRQEDLDGQKKHLDSGKAAHQADQLESRSFQGKDSDPVEGGREQGLDAKAPAGGDGDEDKELSNRDTQSGTSNT